MKYNKYSGSKCCMKNNYNLSKYSGCEEEKQESKCLCDPSELGYNQSNSCMNDSFDNCTSSKTCSNCEKSCNCCDGYSCDFNMGNVQGIRTVLNMLFSRASIEGCPVTQEVTFVDGSDASIVFALIEKNCEFECPPIDNNSVFECKCVKVETKEILLTNPPEVKVNGKELLVVDDGKGCYEGEITEEMLNCIEECKAEAAPICIRAEGWTIDAKFKIMGLVTTNCKVCDFCITITLPTPININDNSVFYKSDFCVTEGKLKICFDSEICLRVDEIILNVDNVDIKAVLSLPIKANLSLFSEKEVCIQGIVLN